MIGRWRWRLAHGAALVIILILAGTAFWLSLQMRGSEYAAYERNVMRQARAAASSDQVARSWLAGPQALQPQLVLLSSLLDARVTALTPQGEFITQSHADASADGVGMGSVDWQNLPEVRAAINRREGTTIRQTTGGAQGTFVALPVSEAGVLVGVLHFEFSQEQLQADLAEFNRALVLVALVATLLLLLLAISLTEYLSFGVRRLTQVVERITAGDLDARILSLQHGELGALAQAFNRMAAKLQSQMKKRVREKDRLNTVMHVMTDGVLILNRNGVVKLINPAGARILNTTVEKAMNRSFVQAVRDHRIAEVWKRCVASGEEEVAAIELGVTQFMRVVVTPFLRRAGRGYLVIMQDLTQVRRLQTVRQDFISNISHELRTPLASLRALTETLRDSALDDPPAATRFLDRMEIEVDSLTQMVEELLELSRIESGQVPLRLNPVLPHAAIVPAVERLRTQAERGQLSLEIDVPRDLPLVLVDAGRIHQVVTNIVHNAIKFTPAQGAITVSATTDATHVTVSVADTGSGIAPQDITRIFERFYKADRSRAVGGTGLGLAIAKHIVQAHGGSIWAVSQEGKGSTFYFSLPRAEPEIEMEGSTEESSDTSASPVVPPTLPTDANDSALKGSATWNPTRHG
ncbi:MAG: HAMP domain-containing protein [Caldilineaceae bacterium]|nr:HAMP domain-containing protein [Caldilineaceae bacterium]